jgi:hypothetical protein
MGAAANSFPASAAELAAVLMHGFSGKLFEVLNWERRENMRSWVMPERMTRTKPAEAQENRGGNFVLERRV